MKNIIPMFDPKLMIDILQKNALEISKSTGIEKNVVTSVSISNNLLEAGHVSIPVKKNNFIGIIQIPYIKDEDIEKVRATGISVSQKRHEIDPSRFTKNKNSGVLKIEDLFLIDSSPEFIAEIKSDGYVAIVNQFEQNAIRYKLKLVVGEAGINSNDFSMLSITIENKTKNKSAYNLYPIISLFSLDDTTVTIFNSILQLDFSRKMNNRLVRSEDLKIVRFKMRLPKDSPNLAAVSELIKLLTIRLKVLAACNEIISNKLDTIFGME